jgi:hypothetical protein
MHIDIRLFIGCDYIPGLWLYRGAGLPQHDTIGLA